MSTSKIWLAVAGAMTLFSGLAATMDEASAQTRCRQGYVWREAYPGDFVCVTPQERTIARQQNSGASSNRQIGGGVYGRNTCRNGYVWREAFPGDVACVTPYERDQARRQNSAAEDRKAWGGTPFRLRM